MWKSNKKILVLICVDQNCKWWIFAIKSYVTNNFIIHKHLSEHTCSLAMQKNHHQQANSSVIRNHSKARYECVKEGLSLSHIVNKLCNNLGVKSSYWKAWKARKCAHKLVRDSPKAVIIKSCHALTCFKQ